MLRCSALGALAALALTSCAGVATVRPLAADGLSLAALSAGDVSPHWDNAPRTSARHSAEPLGAYLEFLRGKYAALKQPGLSERDGRILRRALLEMELVVYGPDERALTATSPLSLFERCWLQASTEQREAETRARARDAHLETFWRWALRRWGELQADHVQRAGRAWLVTEPPLREASRDALIRAVLDWAHDHADDPDFLRHTPSDVALYLLAKRSALAMALQSGVRARAHADYSPSLDVSPGEGQALVAELLVGFIPGVGEVVFLIEVATGVSLSGQQLEAEERLLLGLCVLLPFIPAVVARSGQTLERLALLSGRSLEEVNVLARVAAHFSPAEAAELEALLGEVARGRHLTAAELARLEHMAQGFAEPLARLGEVVRRGGSSPLLGARNGLSGVPLAVGSAEHQAQCWIEYQFRNPDRFKRFTYAIDEQWARMYRTILENRSAGDAFEQAVLKSQGYPKNASLLMPPEGSALQGFIPDAVKGNPSELVWGRPYEFVEVKGREEMALTGNLKAMLEYVAEYGGHVEVWFRSAKHPNGATRLTTPLKRALKRFTGKATVQDYPP